MNRKENCFESLIHAAGKRYYLTCAYARNCLYLLLKALKIGKGDEVIVPAYSCLSIYKAIEEAGATPVYVDCEEGSLHISPRRVEQSVGPRTKLIYVIHTYGIAAKIDEIAAIAHNRKIWLVEDTSHTLNARYKGREVGSFGHFTIFSLTKLFLNYQGAVIATNDRAIFNRMEAMQKGFPAAPKRAAYIPHYLYRLLGSWYERDASLPALLLFKILYVLLDILNIKRETAGDFDYNYFHMSPLAVRIFALSFKKYRRIIHDSCAYKRFQANCSSFLEYPRMSAFQTGSPPNHMTGFIRNKKRLCESFSLRTWHNAHQPGTYPNADKIYEGLRLFPKFFAKAGGRIDRHTNR